MELTCSKCQKSFRVQEGKVPMGRSYIVCPTCSVRINIFKGPQAGSTITNLTGLRFLGEGDGLMERFCEPGELWRVIDVVQPCPDKGRGRSCESENRGRCPNQRLVVRLRKEKTLYKTCMYRKGCRIFDKGKRFPVGQRGNSSGAQALPSEE